MRYLTLGEIVSLHRAIITGTGGVHGIRQLAGLESAVAQPRLTFGGSDLHHSVCAKAAALGFALALNHPFLDGNKRVAHAAMEVFLNLNGRHLTADVDEQERLMIGVASGQVTRDHLERWLDTHTAPAAD